MKSPTEILRKEHEEVLKTLDKLEAGIKDKNIASLKKNVKLLEREFDKHSLNKEEKALFPEFEKFIPREGGPTGVMIVEHKELAELIKRFRKEIKSKNRNYEKLAETGNSIFSILRPHINKENNILFAMADMHIDDKQKSVILKKFRKIDQKY